MGTKYHPKEFIIVGWQDNDLPIFGKIISIFGSMQEVYYRIVRYKTLGIVRHFHSFAIEKTTHEEFITDLSFVDCLPLRATERNASLYITLRTHIENHNAGD